MLALDIEHVTPALLQEMCGAGWPESLTLEFKRQPPGPTDKDRHELLKDVAALANSEGGDLVFGIEEVDGAARSLVPIASEPSEVLERRLIQVLDAGLEPRVNGLRFRRIDFDGGYVLVIRVPPSFSGPHAVKVNTARRFVARNGTTTSDLSFDQLRMAFDRTASLALQARAIVKERIQLLLEGRAPVSLFPGPIRVLHFIPMGGLSGRQAIDLRALHGSGCIGLIEPDWGGGNHVFNLDGLSVYPGGRRDEPHYSYLQVFRTGAFEAASLAGDDSAEGQPDKTRAVWSIDLSKWFVERCTTVLAHAKASGLSGPAVLSFGLLRVGRHELFVSNRQMRTYRSDREHLLPPELYVENLEQAEGASIARPLLDMLWQGFGLERCWDFDKDSGAFKPRNL